MALVPDEERVGLVMREMLAVDPDASGLGDAADLRARPGRRIFPRLDVKVTVSVAAALILVAALVVAGPLRSSGNGSSQITNSGATSVHVPHGWKSYTYGDAQISVPGSWTVLRPGTCPSGAGTTGTLFLGGTTPNSNCSILQASNDYVAISSPITQSMQSNPMEVNGVRVFVGFTSDPILWAAPSLNVQLAASGPNAEEALHTLRPTASSTTSSSAPTAFPAGKAFLSECASVDDVGPEGCGAQLAAQPFIEIPNGAGTGSFTVANQAASTPLSPQPSDSCTNRCVLVATSGTPASGAHHIQTATIVFGS
jgi:hypothetical protein